jgi:hypothetical protein
MTSDPGRVLADAGDVRGSHSGLPSAYPRFREEIRTTDDEPPSTSC